MEHEIGLQMEYLERFEPQEPLCETSQRSAIFCGSGDSLSSAMLARAHSGLKVRVADPLDILNNRAIRDLYDLFLVSVSGRTVSNIRAATLARSATAITARPESELGRICQRIIPLRYPSTGDITAGTISFLSSALCCISLVRPVKITQHREILKSAQQQAAEAAYGGRVFVLGNLQTYPLALYAVAKLYEVLGYGASYQCIEQFSHMDLFSAHPGDTVVIFEPPNRHNRSLAEKIKAAGLSATQPTPPLGDDISQFLFYTFFSQMVALGMAKNSGLHDCHFLTAGALLDASSEMIY